MQLSLFVTALALLAASAFAADPLTIDTPASLKQCYPPTSPSTVVAGLSTGATDGEGNIVAITGINGIWDHYIAWYGTIKAGSTLKFTVVDSDLFLAETAPVAVQDSDLDGCLD
ncbi:hypothetical protein GSI_13361 [Ganoderma sinense ZZ0214-1]|uniref:Uncharacterized protein n=1 Tax=Ganoderma sinense ZZ0214-1 TaxID=1077348 RepID=A0A2G8RVC8_9APHY|nr:hypothetical protein GSI_13361 [Ganoderma sinense ZZ0214-1]